MGKNDLLRITISDGKYTVKQQADGRVIALRYGEEWRDCVGDSLVLSLAQRIEELEESLKYMVNNIGQPNSLETREGFAKAKKLIEAS